jgi:hypothetical protein
MTLTGPPQTFNSRGYHGRGVPLVTGICERLPKQRVRLPKKGGRLPKTITADSEVKIKAGMTYFICLWGVTTHTPGGRRSILLRILQGGAMRRNPCSSRIKK